MLLKNKDNTLHIPKDTGMETAVFGAPAKTPIIHGGGGSPLVPHYVVTPLEALQRTYKNVEYHYGIPIFMKTPSPSVTLMKAVLSWLLRTDNGAWVFRASREHCYRGW